MVPTLARADRGMSGRLLCLSRRYELGSALAVVEVVHCETLFAKSSGKVSAPQQPGTSCWFVSEPRGERIRPLQRGRVSAPQAWSA